MNKINRWLLSALLALSALPHAYAQDTTQGTSTDPHAGHHMADSAAATATNMSEGEIRKVNQDSAKLTIKHGPLTNLDMPGMTMVFQVKDVAMLAQVKEGDKVRFVADRINGVFTVIKLENGQ